MRCVDLYLDCILFLLGRNLLSRATARAAGKAKPLLFQGCHERMAANALHWLLFLCDSLRREWKEVLPGARFLRRHIAESTPGLARDGIVFIEESILSQIDRCCNISHPPAVPRYHQTFLFHRVRTFSIVRFYVVLRPYSTLNICFLRLKAILD